MEKILGVNLAWVQGDTVPKEDIFGVGATPEGDAWQDAKHNKAMRLLAEASRLRVLAAQYDSIGQVL